MSFDAVNRVFRDGKVFNSQIYDSTIGLFIGPTILAMEGKTALGAPQPGVRGVQVDDRWRGGNPRSCGPSSTS